MALSEEDDRLQDFVVIGDRVLISPRSSRKKTRTGLYLPPGVEEKEEIHSGLILKTGPGIPIPFTTDFDEPWKESVREPNYIPLQVQVGDTAIYLQKHAFELEFEGRKYVVVPQSAILLVIRQEFE